MNKPNLNLFVVGAAKSGTTSLYNYLNQHPDIFLPKVKEPNYYSSIDSEDPLVYSPPKKDVFYHNKIINDENTYFSLFENSYDYEITGDCSPSYLWDKTAAKKIFADFPNAKIVIILRDPIMRTFSHYLMNLKNGVEKDPDFLSALKRDAKEFPKVWGDGKVFLYKELSMYYDQVKIYLEVFKKENIKVIIYEEFFSDIELGLSELFNFLKISSTNNINFNEIHNKYSIPKNSFFRFLLKNKSKLTLLRTLVPRTTTQFLNKNVFYRESEKPKITEESRNYLKNIFAEDVRNLEKLLDLNLHKWL
ncbi:sulfotransferase [Mangrovimonas sp. CR14]|uniref:sulfotransferase family protein n=1 Tax=Mangrovimonas sp. CR14 TaxID=2706120 RepID=UPI001422B4EC|nr:sulfotransferase [Mangrovimonas sp. CR14]NIK90867.1 sulfotransferase [Mangrovimonas sp. CR14]